MKATEWGSRLRRLARGDSGQALVEFALVAPLMLILLLGMVEFGRAWNTYQTVTDAAREGARIAAVNSKQNLSADSVFHAVRKALAAARLDSAAATIDTSGYNFAPADENEAVRISVTYPYSFTFLRPFLRWTTQQASISLQTAVVMRNER